MKQVIAVCLVACGMIMMTPVMSGQSCAVKKAECQKICTATKVVNAATTEVPQGANSSATADAETVSADVQSSLTCNPSCNPENCPPLCRILCPSLHNGQVAQVKTAVPSCESVKAVVPVTLLASATETRVQ